MKYNSFLFSLFLFSFSNLNSIIIHCKDGKVETTLKRLQSSHTLGNLVSDLEVDAPLYLPIQISSSTVNFIFNVLCNENSPCDKPVWHYFSEHCTINKNDARSFFEKLPILHHLLLGLDWLDVNLEWYKTDWNSAFYTYIDYFIPEEPFFWTELKNIIEESNQNAHNLKLLTIFYDFLGNLERSLEKNPPKHITGNWINIIQASKYKDVSKLQLEYKYASILEP